MAALLRARFQPWPEASLHSVARKFLDECDLGDEAARAAVVEFMPFSFAAVNKVRSRGGQKGFELAQGSARAAV